MSVELELGYIWKKLPACSTLKGHLIALKVSKILESY